MGVGVWQGTLGTLLGKLGVLLTEEHKLLAGVKTEVRFLKSELESMHAFLKKMSGMEEPDEQSKCWAREVRELSYDIEDKVDEFMLRTGAKHDESISCPPHGFRRLIDRCLSLFTAVSARYEITQEFQCLKRRAVEVIERRTRYKVDEALSKPSYMAVDLRLLAIYAETTGLVGIDGSRGELIQLMMEDEGAVSAQQLKVLSIMGFGGLGKTTLANEIYHKLEGEFQCRAFVSVSQKPNLKKILRNILHQVGYVPPMHTNIEAWDEDQLIITQQEFLRDKRYLIIIDDIWDVSAWHIIRIALPECTNSSRIITTTRIEAVAKACCANHYEYVYKMKPLNDQDSRMLFFERIFGSENACPPYLEEVSARILKKCNGMPLAIITISSLLASQPYKLQEQWQYILNLLSSNCELNPSLEGMRRILDLSYINLPHYLKTCMLYLGIYPEDHIIYKNDLTRQWAAEGFIWKAHGRDSEDVGNSYFNELINRSMIQPVDTYPNGEVQSCRVHDMMLDLILHKSREENFITVTYGVQSLIGLQDKVRRLSLHWDGIDGLADCSALLETIQLSQVRGLARFGGTNYIPPLLKFMHLRVLNLEFVWHGNTDLTMIGHLFQLRYLKIVTEGRVELPNRIQGLQNLETLEIETDPPQEYPVTYTKSIVELPGDIIHLNGLLHLNFPSGVKLPDGIWNLKSLRTLKYFDVGSNSLDNIMDLGDLTNLRDLQISCFPDDEYSDDDVDPLDTPANRRELLFSSLAKLCNLKYLQVSIYGHDDHPSCWDELKLSCLRQLQRLYIRDCWFSRVHRWFGELHNLYDLDLIFQEMLGDDIGVLAQLPSLIKLSLHIKGTPREKITITRSGFAVLKHLSICCIKIWYLNFEAGAMPKLRHLQLYFNAQAWDRYGAAPTGVEHLSGLKEVSVSIGNASAKGPNRRAALSVLRNALEQHPSGPSVNIESHENGFLDFDDFSELCDYDDTSLVSATSCRSPVAGFPTTWWSGSKVRASTPPWRQWRAHQKLLPSAGREKGEAVDVRTNRGIGHMGWE